MNGTVGTVAQKGGAPAFAILLLAAAALFFAVGAIAALDGWRTYAWPRAQAEVVSIGRHGDVYYRYTVGGVNYFGDRLSPREFGMVNAAVAKNLAHRYAAGSPAEIVYDPADPKTSYFLPGPSAISYMLMGIGGFIGFAGLIVLRAGTARRA